MEEPLFSIGTWDSEIGAFTPQEGMRAPCINVTVHGLRRALRELRQFAYDCTRSDPSVVVERTDGRTLDSILEGWRH